MCDHGNGCSCSFTLHDSRRNVNVALLPRGTTLCMLKSPQTDLMGDRNPTMTRTVLKPILHDGGYTHNQQSTALKVGYMGNILTLMKMF